MHSISCHKYPPSILNINKHLSPIFYQQISIITMKHYNFNNLMMMKTKFPSPINSWNNQISTPIVEPFGGFIWPPRFYTCTFCRREFRSAQALGGHMNVHRRDRARLKQSSPPQTREILEIRNLAKDLATDNNNRGGNGHHENEGFIETKLSMGIELFDSGNNVMCKRYKKSSCNVSSSPSPFLGASDIDLELRLG